MSCIRRILTVTGTLLLLFSLTSAPADGNPTAFSANDMTVNNVKVGSSMDEVQRALGVPDSTNVLSGDWVYDGLISYLINRVEEWTYDGLILTFRDGKLVKAKILKLGYAGPHGVTVGMTTKEIVGLFPQSLNSPYSWLFYWNEALGAFDPEHPEADCGYVQKGDDGFTYFKYLASLHPNPGDLDRLDQDAYDTEGQYARLDVKLDNNEVVSLEWLID